MSRSGQEIGYLGTEQKSINAVIIIVSWSHRTPGQRQKNVRIQKRRGEHARTWRYAEKSMRLWIELDHWLRRGTYIPKTSSKLVRSKKGVGVWEGIFHLSTQ